MELKGGQELFPVSRVVHVESPEEIEDCAIESLDLGIGLRVVSRGGGLLAVVEGQQFCNHLVAELFALVRMELIRAREAVDPVMEQGSSHGVCFLVRKGHQNGNSGEGVGDGQYVLVGCYGF